MSKTGKDKIKVLIVDDSALVRNVLASIFDTVQDIEVVDSARDPYEAREKIKKLNPDVLTLDVNMPKMDGVTFLKNLMRLRPMPVVMISSLTEQGADTTLEALEVGAVDFVAKPKSDVVKGLEQYAQQILDKVRMASKARVHEYRPSQSSTAVQHSTRLGNLPQKSQYVIAMGASTGGTEAISHILRRLPDDMPAIIVTQHIPLSFSLTFAKRLDRASPMKVKTAQDGEHLLLGHVYIAPGDQHLMLKQGANGYVIHLSEYPDNTKHRPSVDIMFESVASLSGARALGVLLTGMGEDGARGLAKIHQAGGYTLAQDKDSSVVWGMPGTAVRMGVVDQQLSIDKISDRLIKLIKQK